LRGAVHGGAFADADAAGVSVPLTHPDLGSRLALATWRIGYRVI